MARKPNVFPSYLLHKQSGQARVRINGRDKLLGPYGSEESRILYGQLIAKHAGGIPVDPIADSNCGRLPRNETDDPGPSVGELILVFLKHAKRHYTKNGKPTSEYGILESTVRPLNQLYGMIPAKDFGPSALKAVREKFIEFGWVRSVMYRILSNITAGGTSEPGFMNCRIRFQVSCKNRIGHGAALFEHQLAGFLTAVYLPGR